MIGATVDTQSTTRHFMARSSIAYEHERACVCPEQPGSSSVASCRTKSRQMAERKFGIGV